MKVLLTLYGEERPAQDFSPEEGAAEMAAWQAFDEAARAAGVLIACEGLEPSQAATTIRVEHGRREVTDGPFVETKEVLGGYYLVRADDLDEAIEIAKHCPARFGGVEVRPIQVFE
jgi:hypothetical protein